MRLTVCLFVLTVALLSATWMLAVETRAGMAVDYVVNSTADTSDGDCNDGSCTLRDAIIEVNGGMGTEVIGFNIPGCPPACTIQVGSPLPAIAAQFKFIDGTTQPGFGGTTPVIVIDGSSLVAGDGLTVNAGETTLLGLTIRDFPGDGVKANSMTLDELELYNMRLQDNGGNGLSVAASNQITIEDSVIVGNTGHGVNSVFTTMGSATYEGNTISGNGQKGIYMAVMSNLVVTGNTVENNGAEGIDARATTTANATYDSNVVNGNGAVGIATAVDQNLTMTNNEVSSNQGHGIDASFFTTQTVTLEDNKVTDNDGTGIETAVTETLTASRNDISGNGMHGLDASFFTPTTGTITENTVTENAMTGLRLPGGLEAHYNRVRGNAAGVSSNGAVINAQNNWWGCNEGPGTLDCDSTSGNVESDPWLVFEFSASPDVIDVGQFSTLTGDLRMNSDGADTSPGGHIPNGTLVTFSTNDADIAGAAGGVAKPANNGIATAALSADTGPIVASVAGSIDAEAIQVQVTINEAAATPTPTATATPSPTAAPTPSPTPSATPTPPPGAQRTQGDNDCDGDVDAVDALKGLQHIAAIEFEQEPGCPDIGGAVPAGDAPGVFGDVDCDGDVDAVDQLKILQFVAAIPFTQDEPCVDVGDSF